MSTGPNASTHFVVASVDNSAGPAQTNASSNNHQRIIVGKDNNQMTKRASVAMNGLSQGGGFSSQNCQQSNSNMLSNLGSNQESLENIFKYPTQADANNTKSSINFPRGTTNTKRGFARDAQNQ